MTGEQCVAPIENGAHCLVAGGHSRTAASEHGEGVVETVGDLFWGEGADARGGEFDGEGDAIETTADLDDMREVLAR